MRQEFKQNVNLASWDQQVYAAITTTTAVRYQFTSCILYKLSKFAKLPLGFLQKPQGAPKIRQLVIFFEDEKWRYFIVKFNK